MDLNKVQLIGRSSTEIELKQTPTGKNVVSFSLVTNKAWSDTNGEKQEKAEFHTVVAWGKLAEILSQYAGKGKKLYIEGELQTRNWEAEDGTKRYKTEIVASNVILLDSAGGKSADALESSGTKTATTAVKKTAPKKEVEEEISIEDIPF